MKTNLINVFRCFSVRDVPFPPQFFSKCLHALFKFLHLSLGFLLFTVPIKQSASHCNFYNADFLLLLHY